MSKQMEARITPGQNEPRPPFPKQHQEGPGIESKLDPRPRYKAEAYRPAGKLKDKVALITGGDSGIGRAVALLYAREGAQVAITYLPEEQSDADDTRKAIEGVGGTCLAIAGDLTEAAFCDNVVEQTVQHFGKLDILVANAAHQNRKPTLQDVTDEEFDRTFRTNIYAHFWLSKAAIRHMKPGSAIVNTTSINAKNPSPSLLAYATTKGAIASFTAGLAQLVAEKGIRVNCVAPGPVWTPLIPSTMGPDSVKSFGKNTPLGRAGQPAELAPAYVLLASGEASYITGALLPVTGGRPML